MQEIWQDFPDYQCPHCGSHSIECEGFCTVTLSQDEKGHKFAQLHEFDGVDDNSRCTCTACGKSGRLYAWEVVEGDEQ